MKMRNSEVFDSYAKISLEKGLIKEAEETNPRYDTQDLSTIEALYGVQPNKEDKKSITEQAHPEPVIVAPSHDKVNGLVENDKERQNIMIGICMKPVNGKLTQHIYAEANKNLLDEVIKLAFMLDKKDESDLMVLADSCSERLTKKALGPLAIVGIIAGVSALFGGGHALYTTNNPESQGFRRDAQRALIELHEAMDDYPQLGSVLAPVIEKIQAMSEMAESFVRQSDEIATMMLRYSASASPEEKRNAIATNVVNYFKSGRAGEAKKEFARFQEICSAVAASIPEAIKVLSRANQNYEGTESNWWQSLKDMWQGGVVNSDVEDAMKILAVLGASCKKVGAVVNEQMSKLSQLEGAVDQYSNEETKQAPKSQSSSKEEAPAGKPKSSLPEWA